MKATLSYSSCPGNAYGTEIKEHLLLLSIFLILASSILIFFIGKIYSGRILVPLQHILKELKRIRANSLNRRLKTTGNNDELGGHDKKPLK